MLRPAAARRGPHNPLDPLRDPLGSRAAALLGWPGPGAHHPRMARKTDESIDLLRGDTKNARTIAQKNLAGLTFSMAEFGDLSRITWNEQLGLLVAGHQRMHVLRENGATSWSRLSDAEGVIVDPKTGESFPIRIVRWPEQKHREAQIVANNPHLQGEYTAEVVQQMRELEQEAKNFGNLNLPDLKAELDHLVDEVDTQHRGLEEFDAVPRARPTWILIAAPEDIAAEVESLIRARFGGEPRLRLEKSTDAS